MQWAVRKSRDEKPSPIHERGAVLVVVVVVTVVLTLLGLGILSLGAMESAAALDALRARQAAWGAEAGLRAVKHWFDAPAGSAGEWMVPAPSEVDRSQRRLDPDGTGSYRTVVLASRALERPVPAGAR